MSPTLLKDPFYGFMGCGSDSRHIDGDTSYIWYDSDSYRCISVSHRVGEHMPFFETAEELEAWYEEDQKTRDKRLAETTRLLRLVVDDLPPDVLAVDLSASGKVLWTSSDVQYPVLRSSYYPSVAEYQLQPRQFPILVRSQLTVLDRFPLGVDKISYTPSPGKEKVAVSNTRRTGRNSVFGLKSRSLVDSPLTQISCPSSLLSWKR